MNKQNIEDIYGLTAMQEGMLYHSVKNDSTSMYIEQFSCKLTGSINEDYFWQERHFYGKVLKSQFRSY